MRSSLLSKNLQVIERLLKKIFTYALLRKGTSAPVDPFLKGKEATPRLSGILD